MILEACVETFEEALLAEERGADRIELCAELFRGGITPPITLLESVQAKLNIPIMVMIRPRGGDFVYNTQELDEMKASIDACKSLHVKGVVFGLLDEHHNIDIENTNLLADYAQPLDVTFHKAIDETSNLNKSVKELTQIQGITRILTSGGKSTAREGSSMINEMINTANDQLKILAAGKITNINLSELLEIIHTDEFHGRRIVGNLS